MDWMPRPNRVLVGIAVLQAIAYLTAGYPHGVGGGVGVWVVVSGVLIWRLWRGGETAWVVLIALNTCVLILCALELAGLGNAGQSSVRLALRFMETAGEFALLLHPSVMRYVR